MAKASAKSSSKASVKVVINERRRPIRRRKVVQKKMVELPPVRIYHEHFSQPTFAQLPPTPKQEPPVFAARPPLVGMTPPMGMTEARPPLLGMMDQLAADVKRQFDAGYNSETPLVGYTPPPRTPPTLYTVPPSTLADIKREVDTIFSREPVPNVFPGSIEPRTLFAEDRLAQAFDAGHIVTRRGQ